MDLLPVAADRNLCRCSVEKPQTESLVSEGLQLAAARYPISSDREENLNYNDNHLNKDKREWYRNFFEIFFNPSFIIASF
jgi:hypothetical protein